MNVHSTLLDERCSECLLLSLLLLDNFRIFLHMKEWSHAPISNLFLLLLLLYMLFIFLYYLLSFRSVQIPPLSQFFNSCKPVRPGSPDSFAYPGVSVAFELAEKCGEI